MTKEQSENEYRRYIDEHVNNVWRARYIFADALTSELDDTSVLIELTLTRLPNHDMSKYFKEEFEGYRQWFYPADGEKKNREEFEIAWEHHYTFNDHHPEFWSLSGEPKPMSEAAIAEMFCDWLAMSIKFGTSLTEWYKEHEEKEPFNFHPDTRKKVESWLDKAEEQLQKYMEKQK